MRLVRIENNQVQEYPFSMGALKQRFPNTSIPKEPTDVQLAELGAAKVQEVVKPVDYKQNFSEGDPVLDNGVWKQNWIGTAASPEEIKERELNQRSSLERNTLKQEAFIKRFISMTPAEVETYIDNNTNNLRETRTLLKQMAKMLLLLARSEFQ